MHLFFLRRIFLILILKYALIFKIIYHLLRLIALLLLVVILFILENSIGFLLFLDLLLYLFEGILFGLQLFLIGLDTFDVRSYDFLAFFRGMFLLCWNCTCLGGKVALGVSIQLKTHLRVILARCIGIHVMLDQSFLHWIICTKCHRWLRLCICQFISISCLRNLRHSLRCCNGQATSIHL